MLSQKEVDFYHEYGYLHLPGVLSSAEVEQLQKATDRLIEFASSWQIPQQDFQYRRDPDTGKHVLNRKNSTSKRAVEVQALYGHPRLLAIAEDLLGRDFTLADDALVIKMPEYGAPVPWHRDLATRTLRSATDSLAVVGVDLDASTLDNGCVHLIPGTHKWDLVDIQDLVDEHGFNLPGAIPVETEPGDVLVHAGNALHASRTGRGGRLRLTIYFGAFAIDPYIDEYQASHSLVKLHMQYMFQGMQLRRKLTYTRNENPFKWRGSPAWQVNMGENDHVEWGVRSARPI